MIDEEVVNETDVYDNFEFDGIDHGDYPDYCDAFISSCDKNGVPCTDKEIDELNEDSAFVYEELWKYLH